MKVTARESEDLVGASASNYAELGGLPDGDQIREEYRQNLIKKVADSYDISPDVLKAFLARKQK